MRPNTFKHTKLLHHPGKRAALKVVEVQTQTTVDCLASMTISGHRYSFMTPELERRRISEPEHWRATTTENNDLEARNGRPFVRFWILRMLQHMYTCKDNECFVEAKRSFPPRIIDV